MRVPAQQIRRQLVSVFRAWGMSDAHGDTTADMMVETDLRGVDSHGIGMLPSYDQEFRHGRLNMRPVFKKVCENAATALVDADASLGHPAAAYGMNLAVDKCLAAGVGVVAVFNSHHFGAAGCYSRIADANQPVLVAGDPERVTKRERLENGVPVPDDLMDQLRAVAKNAGVPFVLAGGGA